MSNSGPRSHGIHVCLSAFVFTPYLIYFSYANKFLSGGSVLNELLQAEHKGCTFSALVRQTEQAEKLKAVGVNGILFKSLDDFDVIRDTAKDHDGEMIQRILERSMLMSASCCSCRFS
jgi:hypothetical protein